MNNEHQESSRRDFLKSGGMALGSLIAGGSSGSPAQKSPGGQPLPRGILHVAITDQETGLTSPSRCYLTDANGGFWSPSDVIVYSMAPERHFVTAGEFWMLLPQGHYTLTVQRGLEYRTVTREVEVRPDGRYEEMIALQRWVNMNAQGWYSGDLHNHRHWRDMATLLLAEDLNLAPRLTQWEGGGRAPWVGPSPAGMEAIHRVDSTHSYSVFDTEFERLGAGPGAMSVIGLPALVTSPGYAFGPPNSVFAELGHRQGGYVDEEKIVWRDSAALVALGHIDFAGLVYNHFNPHFVAIETEGVGYIPKEKPEYNTVGGFPLWALDIYYKFLNCGFRLPVSAGTASGIKPCPLGYCRVYVHLQEEFGYHEWFRALKAGRSFATNGPVLFLTVNGKELGETIEFPGESSKKSFKVHAEALTAGEFDRLDLLWKGNVVRTVTATKDPSRLVADFEADFSQSGWFAARAFEKPTQTIRFAQTSPVYVQNGSDRGIVPEDARSFLNWMDRGIKFYENLSGFRTEEDRQTMVEVFRKARSVYEQVARS